MIFEVGEDYFELLGYDVIVLELFLIREVLKWVRMFIFYCLNDGVLVIVIMGNFVIMVKYSGLRGNGILVVV